MSLLANDEKSRGHGTWPNEDTAEAGRLLSNILEDAPELIEDLELEDAIEHLAGLLARACGTRNPYKEHFDAAKVSWRHVATDMISRRNIRRMIFDTIKEIMSHMPKSITDKRGKTLVEIHSVPNETGFAVEGKLPDGKEVCLACAGELGGQYVGSAILKAPSDLSKPVPVVSFRMCESCQAYVGKLAPRA